MRPLEAEQCCSIGCCCSQGEWHGQPQDWLHTPNPQRSSPAVIPPRSQSIIHQLLYYAYNNQIKTTFTFCLQKAKVIFFFQACICTWLMRRPQEGCVENTDPLLAPHNKNKSSAQTSTKIHQNRGKKSFLALSPWKKTPSSHKLFLLIRMQKITGNFFLLPHPEIPAAANEGQQWLDRPTGNGNDPQTQWHLFYVGNQRSPTSSEPSSRGNKWAVQ